MSYLLLTASYPPMQCTSPAHGADMQLDMLLDQQPSNPSQPGSTLTLLVSYK